MSSKEGVPSSSVISSSYEEEQNVCVVTALKINWTGKQVHDIYILRGEENSRKKVNNSQTAKLIPSTGPSS